MTYEEFYKILEDTYSKLYPPSKRNKDKEPFREWFNGNGNANSYIIEWRIGGAGGGNCWGDTASYDCDADDEPSMDLDELFDKICPQMTFKQHRIVMEEVTKKTNRTHYEYYGNYTEYGIKTIDFRELYHVLIKHKVID